MCLASIGTLLLARERVLSQAEIEAVNIAHAFAFDADRALTDIASRLDTIVPQQVRRGETIDEALLHGRLKEGLSAIPYLMQVGVADSTGRLIASSARLPVGTVSVADRAYFQFHRDTANTTLFLDDPIVSRVSGTRIASVSKRISAADGRFVGVVVAPLDLQYFVDLYREISLGERGAIELLNERSIVLAGSATDVGAKSAINPVLAGLGAAAVVERGRFEGSDGVARIGATARVGSRPIFISVARARDQVLADWRRQVWGQGVVLVGVLAIILTLGLVAYRDHGLLLAALADQRRHLALLDSINETTTDAVIVADRKGRTPLYNPAAIALLGRPPTGPFTEATAFDLLEGDQPVERERHPLARALTGESVAPVELVVRRKDVADRYVMASALPVRDADEGIDSVVMICRDITDYRATQLQLQQAQRLKAVGQLTGGVAHDFNNVLTVILGNLDMIASDVVLDDAQQQAVAEVIRAAERGATITRSLLSFSRQQPLQPRSVDVNALVTEAAKLLRPTLGERVEISTALESDAPPALVDPAQLQTAILNLAINARDAMPEGGKLLLETGSARLDEDYAARHSEIQAGVYSLIAVTDTGTGMTKEIVDKVFEPFFTTKGPGRGTGLGLSMVYGFVRQSAGHVKIYSEPGVGTTVKMYLPLSETPADPDTTGAPKPAGGNGELILVVEDDADVRAFACGQLRALNYRVVEAATAKQALDLMTRHRDVALLFTDVVLAGGMNGRELADTIARSQPELPVLYTSGYTDNAIVHHGRLDPGVRLLSKPYRVAALADAVRDAIARVPVT
ncbi:MAG: ATP-binding protein [Reyranellaceae bacterium]